MGNDIPHVGFGVYRIPASRTAEAVRIALDAGYRHIDTAQVYGNEAEVGTAIRESGLPREDVFLTTKLNPQRHGYASTGQELDESLRRLQTSYVDLFLLHWPSPGRDRYLESWRACADLLAEGKVRAIGVSNLTVVDLAWLAERSDTVPDVNQVELHPGLQQAELRRYHDAHGIVTEAWGPLAEGESLTDPTLRALARKYETTPAQLILRWHVQLGNIPLPKSVKPARIRENIAVFDFRIDAEDMARIAALDGDPHGARSRTRGAGLPRWQ
ncbi:aldo/keto reductase [Catenuloplanes indicus]|uniref:2,5-diketo-D-gluconate reductase A n=1 Tax=Catenuloplanes indicus TaxID=137267 RepID=A0AAE3VW47_9ACTN|nr:aldo/keto reductase [Catenuloplanes indicus]MDQ0365293.1 2,5-diketo-D-gluconate reductase A [Catenuloplanes indicus]